MKDWKNILTSICGAISAVSSALLGISVQYPLPAWLITTCAIAGAVAIALMGWAGGRNADLTKKTSKQLKSQKLQSTGADNRN